MLLATSKQIAYLQHLADRVEHMKRRHPSLIPSGLYYRRWDFGMTSDKASARIRYYNEILDSAYLQLHPQASNAKHEDLPA